MKSVLLEYSSIGLNKELLVYRIWLCLPLLFSILLKEHCFGSDVPYRQIFPQLILYDGGGSAVMFPSSERQLVFLGFQKKAKGELLLWYRSLLHEKRSFQGVQTTVIGVLPTWMSWDITREPLIALCHKVIPKEALPYFKITFFDKEKLFSLLELPDGGETSEHIYVFYLDGEKIRWKASGGPTPERLAELKKYTQSK
jgi:hypothetical protein